MDANLLERRIEEVEDVTGSGTAMVSLYISAGTNLASERQRMSQEKSEAANIKSKQNRKNVEKAIDRVNDLLKNYKQTPENGLILFVGVTEDGTEEFIFDELPQRLEYSDYTCDSKFHTEPLREMVAPDHTIGLLVIERGGSAIGELRGTSIRVHYDEESNVMGKHNAGGQCLSPNTYIYGSDGRKMKLKNVSVGENIIGMDIENRQIVQSTIKNKWSTNKDSYKVQSEESFELKASGDHTVFVVSGADINEEKVSNLEVGDKLLYNSKDLNSDNLSKLCSDLVENISNLDSLDRHNIGVTTISSIKPVGQKDLIDIETSTGNFFANGVLVHNSAERFDRLIEEQRDNYFDSVRQKLHELFVDSDNQPTVDGFIIGGTQVTVDNFVSDGYLPKPLEDVRIGGSYSIDIANRESLGRLVERAKGEIESVAKQEERDYMNKFMKSLHGNSDTHATYGEEQVQKALDYGAVQTILVSENRSRDEIAELEEQVENQGGELAVISDDFSEGEQFWQGFNGIGALLRYQIE